MYTIGTAGHIDHGKTTLCKLLTGIDTDRLQEEKERGISIDIGFANLVTPGGRPVGIVDVPGHERFIKNMVAGVSGIEAVLFTIAADEGVMPQTREHMDILRLLGVDRGIIVLTKCDMVDAEWRTMIREDVRKYLVGTPFENAPIAEVSRDDPESIQKLMAMLDTVLGERRPLDTTSLFRMPIDRVFTLKGHGTIITGTVVSGRIKAGEQVEILPVGLQSRVRSIQTFFHAEQEVVAGQRGALNIPDLEQTQTERGHTAASPGVYTASSMVDARLMLLKNLPPAFQTLKSQVRVRFYVGTTEAIGRLHLLEGPSMEGGQEQVVQLRLEAPVVTCKGDRFLLRSFSPMLTIGGGVVLDANPVKHRRDASVVERLAKLSESNPAEIVADVLARAENPLMTAADLAKAQAWTVDTVDAALAGMGPELASADRRKKKYYYLKDRLAREGAKIRELVLAFHAQHPLSLGVDRAALQALYNPRLDTDPWNDLLALISSEQALVVEGSLVREAQFRPKLDPETEAQFRNIESMLLDQGFLTLAELSAASKMKKADFDKLIGLMLAQRVLVKMADGLMAHQKTVSAHERTVVEFLSTRDKASTGDIKERLGLTRKALIPLLEYFDEKGVTLRVGNDRRLRQRPAS
jgi:selenocysteine-specific elongation factor